MKKKMIILFITCFICLFAASDIGSVEYCHVYVVVKDRLYNPVSWAYVAIENTMCWSIGSGYYRGSTWKGSHPVFVSGRIYWVNIQPGYNWIYVYL